MASKRVKTVIFKICENNNNRKSKNSASPFSSDISASRAARKFFFKSKLIYIEKSKRWAQSAYCSFNRLEMASKTVKLFPDWWVCKICTQTVEQDHPKTFIKALKLIQKTWLKTFYKEKRLWVILALLISRFVSYLMNKS